MIFEHRLSIIQSSYVTNILRLGARIKVIKRGLLFISSLMGLLILGDENFF
jgi:hypothetical protein